MFFNISFYFKRFFLACLLLCGLSAYGQEVSNSGQAVGSGGPAIQVSNVDGRLELFWLDQGQVWHQWQKDTGSSYWGCTKWRSWYGFPYCKQWGTVVVEPTWSANEQFDGHLINLTAARRSDGRLEIAGLGGDRALYIRSQTCPGCGWGPWVKQLPASVTNSQWATLQVQVVPVWSLLRYTTQTFDRACSATYAETEGVRGCVLDFGGRQNLAQGKPAYQSSQWLDNGQVIRPASNAVDGRLDTHASHTLNDHQAWWRVDLKDAHSISTVRIWNRLDCCRERLSNFDVELIDQSGVVLESKRIAGGNNLLHEVIFNSNKPAYSVRIKLRDRNYLHLSEVQVYGGPYIQGSSSSLVSHITQPGRDPRPGWVAYGDNLALQRPVSQSSGSDASKAVDGYTPQPNEFAQMTKPDSTDTQPWWRVELAERSVVSLVHVHMDSNPTLQVDLLNENNVVIASQHSRPHLNGHGPDFYFVFSVAGVKAVRIQLNGSSSLNLGEVIVQGVPEVNVALNKSVNQSSKYVNDNRWSARKAVDGNISGENDDMSIAITNSGDTSRQWEVDLSGPHILQMIRIWNRTDCCADRLKNFRLELIGVDGLPMVVDPVLNYAKEITYNGTAGRQTDFWLNLHKITKPIYKIRIKHPEGDYLQLAEVEAFGMPLLNVARGKPAQQSGISRRILNQQDAIQVPAQTMNYQGFTVIANVYVAQRQHQYLSGQSLPYFKLKGDQTDEVWCAQQTNGSIGCGMTNNRNVIITSRAPNDYFGRFVKLALVVEKQKLSLYINGDFVQSTVFAEDFKFGHFQNIRFGNTPYAPQNQGLNSIFYEAKLVAKPMTADEIKSNPLAYGYAHYWSLGQDSNIPMMAADGNPDTSLRTDANATPWWKVHLGTSHCIRSIHVRDSQENLDGLDIELLDDNMSVISKQSWNGSGGVADINFDNCGVYQVRLKLREIYGDGVQALTLNEVEIFGAPSVDVAVGKSAVQSGTNANANAALDGNMDGNVKKGDLISDTGDPSHTNWWRLSLGEYLPHYVSSVRIWNRTDCCMDQLRNFDVRLLDREQKLIQKTHYSGPAGQVIDVYISAQNVHYVEIRKQQLGGALQLAEVQVHGYPMLNLARFNGIQTASQSSNYSPSSKAYNAIDADASTDVNSAAMTQFEEAAWWQVDLGSKNIVHQVRLQNVAAWPANYLNRVQVQLLDSANQVIASRVVESIDITPELNINIYGVGVRKVRVTRGDARGMVALTNVQVLGFPTDATGLEVLSKTAFGLIGRRLEMAFDPACASVLSVGGWLTRKPSSVVHKGVIVVATAAVAYQCFLVNYYRDPEIDAFVNMKLTDNSKSPYTISVPPSSIPPFRDDCASISRVPLQSTNFGLLTSDDARTTSSFNVIFEDDQAFVDEEAKATQVDRPIYEFDKTVGYMKRAGKETVWLKPDLQKYMLGKMTKYFPGAEIEYSFSTKKAKYSKEFGKNVWSFTFPAPIKLTEFEARAERMLEDDRVYKNTEASRKQDCQIHALSAVVPSEPAAVDDPVHYSYTNETMRNYLRMKWFTGDSKEFLWRKLNQQDIDLTHPEENVKLAFPQPGSQAVNFIRIKDGKLYYDINHHTISDNDNRISTGVFSMHDLSINDPQYQTLNRNKKVIVAVVDGSGEKVTTYDTFWDKYKGELPWVPNFTPPPYSSPFNPTYNYPDIHHGQIVTMRLVGPITTSNSDRRSIDQIGVIPSEVNNPLNLDLRLFFRQTFIKRAKYLWYTSLGKDYPFGDVIKFFSVISDAPFSYSGDCFLNLRCFNTKLSYSKRMKLPPSMYTPPEIINLSISAKYNKDEIVDVQKNINKEKFIFNYGCGSKVNRDMLNSVNAIIIAAAGNDPKKVGSYPLGCDEHILGVVGSGHKLKGNRTKDDDGLLYDSLISSDNGGDILANRTSHPFFANDDQSTASILPGAWVAQAYYAYVRTDDYGIVLGTSYSTPTVSGILATSFALNGENEPISITPSQIVNLAQKSVSSRLYVKYYDHKLRKIIDSSAYKLPIMKADCFYMGYRKEYHPGFPAFKREVIKRLRDKENCAEKEEL